jgi:hypothetical protein
MLESNAKGEMQSLTTTFMTKPVTPFTFENQLNHYTENRWHLRHQNTRQTPSKLTKKLLSPFTQTNWCLKTHG